MMRRPLSAALLIGVVGLGTAAITLPAHAGSPTVHAGLTSIDAAPSCWAIKQSFPSSKDGIYWLATAALQAPQPFYCDMTTDGGGWVLIGRGRQGWDFTAEGQQAASAVGATVTGTAAFSPAHLTNDLVDGLLDNGAPAALDDGLRVRRAKNATGTSWQELRLKFSNMSTWS